jgi:hypothetical protein
MMDENSHNRFLNDRVDFLHMRPLFDDDFLKAANLLGQIKKEKDMNKQLRMECRFSFLVDKIRSKKNG